MRKSKKRRGRGKGRSTIASDGRWVSAVVTGYKADTGKPIRKVVYGATKQEVQDKLDELRQKVKAGLPDGDKLPLRRALEFWLDCHVKPKVDAATYLLHKQRVKDYLLPQLGHHAVASLNSVHGAGLAGGRWNATATPPTFGTSAASCCGAASTSASTLATSAPTRPGSWPCPARGPRRCIPSTPPRRAASCAWPRRIASRLCGCSPWTPGCVRAKCWPSPGRTSISRRERCPSRNPSAPATRPARGSRT